MDMGLSDCALALWAKSSTDGEGHPLIAHLLDVAACAEAILELEPERTRALYAQDFNLPWEKARGWLLTLVALHDLGKASPAFQHKWPVGARRVNEKGLTWNSDINSPNHAYVSQYVLEELLPQFGWQSDVARFVGDAVGAHHGFRAQQVQLGEIGLKELGCKRGNGDWDGARKELARCVIGVFSVDLSTPLSIPNLSAEAFMRLAGLTSFADWIGSNSYYFGFQSDIPDPDAYYRSRLVIARRALAELGWKPRVPLTHTHRSLEGAFQYLAGPESPFKPRKLQEEIAELVTGATSPMLILVEAPMGEGKTEAAFYAHLELQRQLGHRGMYVALPTQATGNAMFERTSAFLVKQGREVEVDLQLQHGAASLSTDFAKLRIEGIYDESGGVVRAEEWFTHRKRALLSEYGVGTVDQALLTVLNVKHQFVRIWGLGNRTVVIDEVHAYDTYTQTLIEALVEWLLALGSSVVLLSATLPKASRGKLLKAYGAKDLPEGEYPRIYRVSNGEAIVRPFNPDPERRQQLVVKPLQADLASIAALLDDQVKEGGCAVAIVNTVQRAQELYQALKAQSSAELYLFHARYPADERKEREELVLQKFGKQGERPTRAILVATQVVEQSLDLDFDLMLTDLAPVDLVLQRAGRLHRHKRANRHRHDRPMLYVAGLEHNGDFPDLESTYWRKVYDEYVLLRSWWVLRSLQFIELPGDIDDLIEAVYGEAMPSDLSQVVIERMQKAKQKLDKHKSEAESQANHAVIGLPSDESWRNVKPLEKADEEDDPSQNAAFIAQTRLGKPSMTVIPIYAVDGKYKLRLENEPISLDPDSRKDFAKDLYMRSVRLSLFRVSGIDGQGKALGWVEGRPKSWARNTLLRGCYPLLLGPDGIALEYPMICLDTELGIVYAKSE